MRSPLPHLHRDWAHRCHICTATGLTPPTFAILHRDYIGSPSTALHRLSSLRPHLHLDCAQCRPRLHRDWAQPFSPCPCMQLGRACPSHICTATECCAACCCSQWEAKDSLGDFHDKANGGARIVSAGIPARRCPDLQRDWAYHRPHLHLDCARTYLICTRTGLHSINVCTGTGLIAPITAREVNGLAPAVI